MSQHLNPPPMLSPSPTSAGSKKGSNLNEKYNKMQNKLAELADDLEASPSRSSRIVAPSPGASNMNRNKRRNDRSDDPFAAQLEGGEKEMEPDFADELRSSKRMRTNLGSQFTTLLRNLKSQRSMSQLPLGGAVGAEIFDRGTPRALFSDRASMMSGVSSTFNEDQGHGWIDDDRSILVSNSVARKKFTSVFAPDANESAFFGSGSPPRPYDDYRAQPDPTFDAPSVIFQQGSPGVKREKAFYPFVKKENCAEDQDDVDSRRLFQATRSNGICDAAPSPFLCKSPLSRRESALIENLESAESGYILHPSKEFEQNIYARQMKVLRSDFPDGDNNNIGGDFSGRLTRDNRFGFRPESVECRSDAGFEGSLQERGDVFAAVDDEQEQPQQKHNSFHWEPLDLRNRAGRPARSGNVLVKAPPASGYRDTLPCFQEEEGEQDEHLFRDAWSAVKPEDSERFPPASLPHNEGLWSPGSVALEADDRVAARPHAERFSDAFRNSVTTATAMNRPAKSARSGSSSVRKTFNDQFDDIESLSFAVAPHAITFVNEEDDGQETVTVVESGPDEIEQHQQGLQHSDGEGTDAFGSLVGFNHHQGTSAEFPLERQLGSSRKNSWSMQLGREGAERAGLNGFGVGRNAKSRFYPSPP
ncbi:hypothetical protein HK102_002533 [Quaeritorhiza haematococci]|nr:hypothetical protein HK102_002533 [Quaeritorhiza haematococci]